MLFPCVAIYQLVFSVLDEQGPGLSLQERNMADKFSPHPLSITNCTVAPAHVTKHNLLNLSRICRIALYPIKLSQDWKANPWTPVTASALLPLLAAA